VGGLVVLLSGGGGGAKLARGLASLLPPEELVVIGNTGDDLEWYGLRVCPDLDILLYTLSGRINQRRGWGIRGDTFAVLDALAHYGEETWFRLGDRDLATCLLRTHWLQEGLSLTEATHRLCARAGVRTRIDPMSDDPVRTRIQTPQGELDFQTYFVRRGHRDPVLGVRFAGIEGARPSPVALDAIHQARGIVLGPSNPFVSIGPILAVPGIEEAIRASRARRVAVTPIVAGRALKGPLGAMLRTLGHRPDAVGVAALYAGLVDVFVLDRQDAGLEPEIARLGMRVLVCNTVMRTSQDQRALARRVLRALELEGGL
jgi:LPPG:FO 2-phospho-L-lactate transferase